MNSKMTTNSQLSTTEPKKQNKLIKQLEQEQNHRNRDHMEDYQLWEDNGGKGTGNKKHSWQVQNRHGEVKNNIGNEEAKELICATHGHELRWGGGMLVGEGQKRIKGRKKEWDNCNNIINKIYFKK